VRERIRVSQGDMEEAMVLISEGHKHLKARQSLLMMARRPPKWLRCSRSFAERCRERAREHEDRAKWLLGKLLIKRYIHVDYALSTGLAPEAGICFIACPPQITYPEFGAVYTPSSYINVLFIPCRDRERGRATESLLARFCYSYLKLHALSLISKVDEVRRLYEDRYRYYLARKGDSDHADRLALRDVARVVVGNVWLVWSWYAKQSRLIKRIVPPYHLAREPWRHRMIEPYQIVVQTPRVPLEDLYRISWRKIVEER